ncbi:sulfatase family protein [Flavilitoribacter nigricans]|uniref:Sulfatase n=1 Tax=Flavilitoribacter nigricans (strain ATCC 23147 / DSM 23189 / NBRC 102662 / NCIMB 1420 / SS-2) TaxID=1122177 RepID=A0A2D0NBN5_FLAN2|nr:sulfatase [Flavilitoribacter nigricans]PHN05921.1 sulfatase [Flavilitoribacter nigricans DSM 23189 = NBRC 102662]
MKRLLLLAGLLLPLLVIGRERPNILFIISEDNGPELGSYGAPVKTPHLDRLAKRGVLFNRAFVPQAGCSQSRAAILSGLYPHQNGQIGLATWKYHMYREATPNIPRSLQTAGYRTGIIGKLHVNPESAFPFDFTAIPGSNFARKDMDQYAAHAEKFINESDQPFYLQVNYPDAHAPFIPQVDNRPKKPLTGDEAAALPYMALDHSKLRSSTADYYNCMMRLDTYIGDLIKVLKKSGKYRNTLIIYIGDHGADLLRGKRTSYEGGLRIPLIVSWPGVARRNIRLEQLTSTIDLYPTFLEVAGLPVPAYLPGRSILPLLRGEEVAWRRYLFTEFHVHSNHNPYPQRTVRDDRYKLIWNPLAGTTNPGYAFTLANTVKIPEEEILEAASPQVREAYLRIKSPPEFELYDLQADPFEINDLSEDPDRAEILERLRTELRNWQQRTRDPLIDPDKARRLFDLIRETGIDRPRKTVPYAEFLDPGLDFEG